MYPIEEHGHPFSLHAIAVLNIFSLGRENPRACCRKSLERFSRRKPFFIHPVPCIRQYPLRQCCLIPNHVREYSISFYALDGGWRSLEEYLEWLSMDCFELSRKDVSRKKRCNGLSAVMTDSFLRTEYNTPFK